MAFLKTLTDERVRCEKAPFDHLQLFIPNGHPGDETSVTEDGVTGQSVDSFLELPAVGYGDLGTAGLSLDCLGPFEAGLEAPSALTVVEPEPPVSPEPQVSSKPPKAPKASKNKKK